MSGGFGARGRAHRISDTTVVARVENAIPVSLSLPLREERYIGAPVIAVFENLLPDNETIRRRVAERRGPRARIPTACCPRSAGIVSARCNSSPTRKRSHPARIEGRRLADKDIGAILKDLGTIRSASPTTNFGFRSPAPRKRQHCSTGKGQWHKPDGATPTTHILKPQIGKLPNGIDLSNSVENEHFCLEFVRALGLPVAKSKIAEFAGKRTSSSSASTVCGQGTGAFCACRRKIAARLSRCRRASSTKSERSGNRADEGVPQGQR